MSQHEQDAALLWRIRLAAEELNKFVALAARAGLRIEMHTVDLHAESMEIPQYYFNAWRRIEIEEDDPDVHPDEA